MGPKEHERLEAELAEWTGMPYVVACSSGTAALHLACEALGVRGKVVTVPDYTMIACPNAVAAAGGTPVFVDCRRDDLLVDQHLQATANSVHRPAATMLVHIYGRRCESPAYLLIEDMAEIHGVRPYGNAETACWSFYKNKIVHGEEGGAVAFRNKDLADKARRLRCLGFTDAHDYRHEPYGMNYRLADSLAARIRYCLGEFESHVERRRRVEAVYDEKCPMMWRMPARQSPWVYDLRIPGMTHKLQDMVVKMVRGRFRVEARHGFKPMSQQAQYTAPGALDAITHPERHEAAVAAQEVVYLPLAGPVSPDLAGELFGAVYNLVCANRSLIG